MIRARAHRAVALLGVLALLIALVAPAATAQPYVASGTPITGGEDTGSAVPLAPGTYVDRLARGSATSGTDGSTRYYAITLLAGQRPYLAATVATPSKATNDEHLTLSIDLTAPGRTTPCASADESDDGFTDRRAAVTAVVAPGAAGAVDDTCPAGKIVVRIARSGALALDDPIAVEVAYRLEPVAGTAGLPSAPATTSEAQRPDLTGRPAALRSGDGFTSAPVVGDGIYRDTIATDDVRIVRVHLDWGQRLAYSFTAAPRPGLDSADGIGISAAVRNPVRQLVDQASGSSTTATIGPQDAAMNGATPVPVRYANRDSDDDDVARCSLAGDWFLVLTTDHPDDGTTGTTVPYTLQIQVFGAADRAPQYRAPVGSSSTSGAAPSDDGSSSGSSSGSSIGPVIGIAAGVVVLAALGALLLLLRQRRAHT